MDPREQMLDRQRRVFRIAMDPTRHGLTLKMIAADSALGLDSVRNYAAGETVMPMTALDALIGVLPDDLLSLLLPAGRIIATIPDGIDYDEFEALCRDFLAKKGRAHHPDSPGGRELALVEEIELDEAVARIARAA